MQVDLDYYEHKEGCVYSNGIITEINIPKPSRFHKWDGTKWIDNRPIHTYKENRANEYPSIVEQLDMLWHSMDSGVMPKAEPFYSSIQSIKTKYPKE